MAYRVDYSKSGMREEVRERTFNISKAICTLALIFLIVLMGIIYPQKHMLEELLIPGDAEVTKQATAELVSNLRGGEGISEALQAFCVEIIENADIS